MRKQWLLALAGIGLVAGCATSTPQPHQTALPPSTSPSASIPGDQSQTPDCLNQVDNWKPGGLSDDKAIVQDLGNLGTDTPKLAADLQSGTDPSADEQAVNGDANSFYTDVQNAQVDMPPTCVPNLTDDYNAALADMSTAATDLQGGMTALQGGDFYVAGQSIKASNTAIAHGTVKLKTAMADITTFNNANGG
jgi:hypothetical protein